MQPDKKLNQSKAAQAFDQLLSVMDNLREKCPWDQEQTMASLRHLTIEETFELAEAVLQNDMEAIKKELGDLLLHIVFYARIASESQDFTIKDVIQTLCEKLVFRHPHIYGKAQAKDAQAVRQNWEKLKLKEKTNQSVLSGVPSSLPSLIKAMRIREKVSAAGFGWQKKETAWRKVQEEMQELTYETDERTEKQQKKVQEEFGDLLFALVDYARFIQVNPEDALEKANRKFTQRFQYLEQQVIHDGKQLSQLSLQEQDSYWQQAKKLADLD